jgi:hypothetical protein
MLNALIISILCKRKKEVCGLLFVVWRLAFGVWCLAFGVCGLVFGVWRLVLNAQIGTKSNPESSIQY